MRNGQGRTLKSPLDMFVDVGDPGPPESDAAPPESAAKKNGATGAPVPVAVPTIAEADRAREILERIDLDPIASDASNGIVKTSHAACAERADIEWTGTAWLRIAHDASDEAHALSRIAECVDALVSGSLEAVLVDLPSASCVHAPAQELLAIAERLVIRVGTPTVTVLAGARANGAAFEQAFAGEGAIAVPAQRRESG